MKRFALFIVLVLFVFANVYAQEEENLPFGGLNGKVKNVEQTTILVYRGYREKSEFVNGKCVENPSAEVLPIDTLRSIIIQTGANYDSLVNIVDRYCPEYFLTSSVYDSLGRLLSLKDNYRDKTYHYNAEGKIECWVNWRDDDEYTDNRNLNAPHNRKETFNYYYDNNGNLKKTVSKSPILGKSITKYEYDAEGREIRKTFLCKDGFCRGREKTLKSYKDNKITEKFTAKWSNCGWTRSYTITWLLDDKGKPIEKNYDCETTVDHEKTLYEYDSCGRVTKESSVDFETDSIWRIDSYIYDNNGNLVEYTIWSEGNWYKTDKYEYDIHNHITRYVFDNRHYRSEEKYEYEYDEYGNIIAEVDYHDFAGSVHIQVNLYKIAYYE